jgi:hypothetical protein
MRFRAQNEKQPEPLRDFLGTWSTGEPSTHPIPDSPFLEHRTRKSPRSLLLLLLGIYVHSSGGQLESNNDY